MLYAAWRRVRANKGCAGGDAITIAAFERSLDRTMEHLSRSLRDGTYRPGPLRRVLLPKPDGRQRRLAVPCVGDRVVQTAMVLMCGAEFDRRFSAVSHAYRPGRSVDGALADFRTALSGHRRVVVDIDIEGFFDSIPHLNLLQDLALWIEDESVLRLVALWLRSFSRSGRGVAQGAPISPLLSNLYLHPLDRLLRAAGHAAIRYADDMVITCASRRTAKAALQVVRRHLATRGLRLNPAKTRIVNPGEPLIFLGRPAPWPAR